jgi:hypothetical protein
LQQINAWLALATQRRIGTASKNSAASSGAYHNHAVLQDRPGSRAARTRYSSAAHTPGIERSAPRQSIIHVTSVAMTFLEGFMQPFTKKHLV